MNKELFKEIALQAGGSHYPGVGGQTLNQFADLLLAEVIKTIEETPKHCAYTTYDLGTVECTIEKVKATIKERFEV